MSKTDSRHRKLSSARRRARYVSRRIVTAAIGVAIFCAFVVADNSGLFGHAPRPDLEKYNEKTFRVARVVDGDTIDLDVPDGRRRTTRVRLWGVDTPETVKPDTPVQYFGPQASAFTKKVAAGKTVRLILDSQRTRGKYGRLLAYVVLPDGTMLNRVLVAKGYGYADPRFEHKYRGEFLRLQEKARRDRTGLWLNVRKKDLPYYYSNLRLDSTKRPSE